jgi:hypothetical protein
MEMCRMRRNERTAIHRMLAMREDERLIGGADE